MIRAVSWLLLAVCVAIAAGGYYQLFGPPTFFCGMIYSYPQPTILAAVALAQTALYLAGAASTRWAKVYRVSQAVVLPFVLFALMQIFHRHRHTVIFFAALIAIPICLSLLLPRWRWMRAQLPATCALFTVSALGFLAGFGQIPLTLPGVIATGPMIVLTVLAASAVSVAVIGSLREQPSLSGGRFPDLARYLPLALLLFPVLRAKLPDVAYDSYMYKITLPYQIAEWRTGDVAIIDGFMVGTNLQELLNGLLVAITRDFLPPFISTISFVLLLLIMPLAFPSERQTSPIRKAVIAFAGVSAFVLCEAGIDQGTAYQEPLLLLFMVAALIRCPFWPAFLAAAIAVKVNAVFIAPLILLYHLFGYRSFFRSPRYLLIGVLTGLIVLVPQINRNVIYSGRILGLNETLATVTDPPGPNQVMAPGETRYDEKVRGGVLNNAALSACNMLALSDLCPTAYNGSDNLGFHIFPASRAPLFAVIFSVAVLAGACVYPKRRLRAAASVAVFLICYAGLLGFLSEGRYFLPVSFGFSVLLLMNLEQAEDTVLAMGSSRIGQTFAVILGCFLIGSNLLPGTFTNSSWNCDRPVTTPVQERDVRSPETPLQSFLAAYTEKYKQTCPPPGLPPVILAQNDLLNSPYLGAQRIFHVYTQQMITRFFAANPARQTHAASAILAIVSQDPAYAEATLGPARTDFAPCFSDDKMKVMCSKLLAPAGTQCATSLYHPQ